MNAIRVLLVNEIIQVSDYVNGNAISVDIFKMSISTEHWY